MKHAIRQVLWATIENTPGLWEIHWELNTLFPENSGDQNKAIAKDIVQELLEAALVEVFTGIWGDELQTRIAGEEAMRLLAQDRYWNPPAVGETCIMLSGTERGKATYQAG